MTAGSSGELGSAGDLRRDHPGLPDLSRAIGMLPVASLLLAQDGSAIEANEKWAGLTGIPAGDSLGDGWLGAIDAIDRKPLRALIQGAAADGIEGSAGIRITTPGPERWSHWSWGPVPARGLIVTVADLASGPAPAKDPGQGIRAAGDLASMVTHRLFGVGLLLQSASAMADSPVSAGLQEAADELDSVIREVRSLIFRARPPSDSSDSSKLPAVPL